MRRYAGADFPLGFKMSAWEDIHGGIQGGEDAIQIARRMADEGVCYVHVGTLNTTIERVSRYPSVPCMYLPRNTLLPLAAEIKPALGATPVMGTGSVIVPEEAEQLLAEGQCDLLALGRTLLADPHWAANAEAGRRIRPCIRCNVCHHQLWLAEPLICQVNPHLLKEAQAPLQPAARPRQVMVVGGGPGGMQAALTAAARGHQVTLHEAQPYLGGMLFPGSRPSCKSEVGLLLDYFAGELADSSVSVRLGAEVTLEMVQAEQPDALVIAVGSRVAMPDIPGIDQPHVVTAIAALRDRSVVTGRRVVILDGGDVGCETACHLAEAGHDVTLIELLPQLMTDQPIANVKMALYQLLADHGVRCFTNNQVTQIDAHTVEVRGPEGGRTLPADAVVIATGLQPNATLRETLRLGCAEVHIVGDCASLGHIREAVCQGDLAGRLI
jgi:2-enoate reductase